MKKYTAIGTDILNKSTENLKDLNELGIYLSKQTDINALKVLKLMILTSELNYLNKPFDINSIKTSTKKIGDNERQINESIIGNLSMNPQYFGLEIMEFIIKNFKVDLNLEPYNSGYSIFDFWMHTFSEIEWNQNQLYKRYDMVDKKINMIDFMIENNFLNKKQLNCILSELNICIKKKFSYTPEQLSNMEKLVNKINIFINIFEKNLEKIYKIGLINENISMEEIYSSLANSDIYNKRKEIIIYELKTFESINDQYYYITEDIPMLIKNKIIK